MPGAYACLQPGCSCVFEVWGEARKHMKACSFEGKPDLQASKAKAEREGLTPAPREDILPPPSEEELVAAVQHYYSIGPHSSEYRKHVLVWLRKRYGNQPFGAFGYGDFISFGRRHGLQVYPEQD